MMCYHTAIAEPKMTVYPLWDVTINSTQPCHVEERNTSIEQDVLFRGTEHHTCSIQVNASEDTNIGVEIPAVDIMTNSLLHRLCELRWCSLYSSLPNALLFFWRLVTGAIVKREHNIEGANIPANIINNSLSL